MFNLKINNKMKHKFSINRLTLAFASLLLCAALNSCNIEQPYIISYKSVLTDNPHLSRYCYSKSGYDWFEIIDSTSRYEIGDDVRKYSVKK
jgi:hypothetical protein